MNGYNKPFVKSVAFYHHRKEDMILHEKLKHLEHGEFQNETKRMWREKLAKEETERTRNRATIQR